MKISHLFISILVLNIACMNQSDIPEEPKQQIIKTLKDETKYFCERNLEKWQAQWSHQPFISKMYAGKVEFEELIGWEAINQFTVQHIKKNPESLPIPDIRVDYDIHLFDNTALVFYSKNVDNHLVRETRFMVKEDNKWKIARMQTIY